MIGGWLQVGFITNSKQESRLSWLCGVTVIICGDEKTNNSWIDFLSKISVQTISNNGIKIKSKQSIMEEALAYFFIGLSL